MPYCWKTMWRYMAGIQCDAGLFLCHCPSVRPEKMTAHPYHWSFGREIFVKWVIMCIFKD